MPTNGKKKDSLLFAILHCKKILHAFCMETVSTVWCVNITFKLYYFLRHSHRIFYVPNLVNAVKITEYHCKINLYFTSINYCKFGKIFLSDSIIYLLLTGK